MRITTILRYIHFPFFLLSTICCAFGQQDSSHIYTHLQQQMSMMSSTMSLPSLPSVSYTVPSELKIGNQVSYLPVNSGGAVYNDWDVANYAGTGTPGYMNGAISSARFNGPGAILFDMHGHMYVGDASSNRIRRISPAGIVSTFVGSGVAGAVNGTGESASINNPNDMAFDGSGNMYISDRGNHTIRKVTPSGVVTTFAGGIGVRGFVNATGTAARFNAPAGIETDAAGNVFLVDEGNLRIRKITPAGTVSTFVGSGSNSSVNGTGTAAGFHGMKGIARDASGNFYVSEYNAGKIRKITPGGIVTTFAGSGVSGTLDGTGTSARFSFPMQLAFDAEGNLYVNQQDLRVRRITPAGVVTTVAGSGVSGMVNGAPLSARFSQMGGICVGPERTVYLSDYGNNHIRRMGTGLGYSISPQLPDGLEFNKTTGAISGSATTATPNTTYTIKAYNAAGVSNYTLSFATVYPAPVISYTIPPVLTSGEPVSFAPTNTGSPVFPEGFIRTIAGSDSDDFSDEGYGDALSFGYITGMVYNANGTLYFYDDFTSKIRTMSPSGYVSFFAGSGNYSLADGTGVTASFDYIADMVMDSQGNIYVCEPYHHVIRKITPGAVVTTIAGAVGTPGYVDGIGSVARFHTPYGLAIDQYDNLYVRDAANNRIRKIVPSGEVSTLAGNGSTGVTDGPGLSASFSLGSTGGAIDTDSSGNVYVLQSLDHVIRKITPSGHVSTYAGAAGVQANHDGSLTDARFYLPSVISIDRSSNDIYVAQRNGMIRKISSSGEVSTVAGKHDRYDGDGGAFDVGYGYFDGILWGADGGLLIADSDYGMGYLRKYEKKSYSISPALPAGLSLGADGVISGTPTAAAPLTAYTVTGYNHIGTGTATFSFSVGAVVIPAQPSSSQNYIMETVVRDSGIMTLPQLDALPVSGANRSVQYYDGLGRPLQTVQWQASPQQKDIVQHMEYDVFGRESKKYLPYVSSESSVSYKTGGSGNVQAFYGSGSITDIVRTPRPYAETVFENSPLNRVQQQGAPGDVWQPYSASIAGSGHTVKTDYGTNVENEVQLWTVSVTGASGTGNYPPGRLYKTVIKDENWTSGKGGTVEEYRDFDDRVVLKRVWKDETEALNTYYVYDDFGDLRYVIPPGYLTNTVDTASSSFREFVYAYNYDGRRRMVEKKIPGKGWEYTVYNKNDQPVLTQDAVQRGKATQEWSYSKYDAFGRVTESGIYSHSYTDRTAAQTALDTHWDNSGAYWEEKIDSTYTDVTFPTAGIQPLVVNYYDDYVFEGSYRLLHRNIDRSSRTKTLLTGMKVYRDNGTAPLLTVNYYDDRARLIQSAGQNHLGGTDYVTNTYNFVGELLTSKREHRAWANGALTTILTSNDYDHVGRLVETRKKINNDPEIVQSRMGYNEIGQLVNKDLHVESSVPVQEIAYRYNERGWLTQLNDPETIDDQRRFGMKLEYGVSPESFNGNIGSVSWNTEVSELQTPTPVNRYGYTYDKLNRLTLAAYSNASATNAGFYNEQLVYDNMGNIQSLKRANGSTSLYNDFGYSYLGNQLTAVTDAGSAGRSNSFTYNANGNAITNSRTGITDIGYNYLNLPIRFTKGSQQLLYTYDATGSKLRKQLGSSITDYVGGIQYTDGTLAFIQTEEGRILPNGSSFIYEYYLKDHLGNTRAVVDHTGAVKQITDYYPFGMEMNVGSALNTASNQYKYNGKELQPELGLEQYDYGARFYDAEIGRWNVVDPLAEDYDPWSPYVYTLNNPIRFVDPDGTSTYVIQNSDGTYRVVGGNKDDDDRNIYTFNFKDGKFAGMSSIGESATMTSFYNTDKNKDGEEYGWMGTIDPKNNSGKQFLDNLAKEDPSLGDYIENATTDRKYDFKATNGTNKKIYGGTEEYFRGMPIATGKDGKKVYASARDVGNIGAGYVAGLHSVSWLWARKAFDKLESKQKGVRSVETAGSQNAQRLGWETGIRDSRKGVGALPYRWIRAIPGAYNYLKK